MIFGSGPMLLNSLFFFGLVLNQSSPAFARERAGNRPCTGHYQSFKTSAIKYTSSPSRINVDLSIAYTPKFFPYTWNDLLCEGHIEIERFTDEHGNPKVRYHLSLSNISGSSPTIQMAIFSGTPSEHPDSTMDLRLGPRSTDEDCAVDDPSSIEGKTMTLEIYYAH